MQDPGSEQSAPNLLPHHITELKRSGITTEAAKKAGCYSETFPNRVNYALNWKGKGRAPALMFRYRDLVTGELSGYVRAKLDVPVVRNGKANKYESPKDQPNRLYCPPGTFRVLKDAAVSLFVTEGEKKAIKADQEGLACIAVPGVYAWKQKKQERSLPDFDLIEWKGRTVYICFDSDSATNEHVQDGLTRLARHLKTRGAKVLIVTIPEGLPDSEGKPAKVGLDDYLVANGVGKFHSLLDVSPEFDEGDGQVEKVRGDSLDAMTEARKFINQCATHGALPTLRAHRQSIYGWTGHRYTERDEDEVASKLYIHLDQFAFRLNRSCVSNILAAIKAIVHVDSAAAGGAVLDLPFWISDKNRDSKNFIAMDNGILDLERLLDGKTDCLLPHSPDWFSTACLPYPFCPTARCPRWLDSLNRSLGDDEQRIMILQEFAGLCVTFDVSFQRFLLLHGDGGTGKSTYCGGLASILGTENVTHVHLESFGERFALYPTLGKLANIATEIGEIGKVAEGILKSFTSGDAMQFDRKNLPPVNAVPTARLVLSTNTLPRFQDRSSGLWRRMLLVPFTEIIPESERVRGMDKPEWWKERGQLPGMFNWALAGLHRLRQQGRFTDSEVCRRELGQYRTDCNPAATFLQERYLADARSDVVTAEIYKAYSEWCEQNGYRRLAANSFGREIARAFPKATQGKVYDLSGRRTEGYFGVRQHDELADQPESVGDVGAGGVFPLQRGPVE